VTPLDPAVLWAESKPNSEGLIPCVTQDVASGAVLMLAWVNRDALEASISSGYATYWSRSRACLWEKGATSGNRQALKHIRLDCDGDTLLYTVEAKGPACHEGSDTCFSRRRVGNGWRWEPQDVLQPQQIRGRTVLGDLQRSLDADLAEAASDPSAHEHDLIRGGAPTQSARLKTDAEAVAHALGAQRRDEIAEHAATLVYDLALALRGRGVDLDDVLGRMRERKKGPGNK